MGIGAQRLWREKERQRQAGKPAAPPPPSSYTYAEVQEIRRAYEQRLSALQAEFKDRGRREVVVSATGEAKKLIDEASERFEKWADELRADVTKARDELEQTKTLLAQVTAERDELAELLEQATAATEGTEAEQAEGQDASSEQATQPAEDAADTSSTETPPAEQRDAKDAPPADAPKPKGKGGRSAR